MTRKKPSVIRRATYSSHVRLRSASVSMTFFVVSCDSTASTARGGDGAGAPGPLPRLPSPQ